MADRFLVVKLGDLGDVLTATPALRALRLTYPRARIDTLVTPIGASALEGLDSVDDRIAFEKAWFDRPRPAPRSAVAALRLAARLRRARYDRVFLLHHLFTPIGRAKYAALLAAAGSPWRGGLAEDSVVFLTDRARDEGYGVKPEADYWLDVAALAGARNPAPHLELRVGARAAEEARRWDGDPLVVLYPGSGAYSPARRWPAARYVALGRRLGARLGPRGRILIVGGEDERALASAVRDGIGGGAVSLAGQTDLQTLAAILRRADLFVGNDGGVMHVAGAVDTPIVAIFGPSNHVSWGPYPAAKAGDKPRSIVVRADLPCAPCLYRGYLPGTREGCPSRDCLDQVSVDAVLAAALSLLGDRGVSAR